MCTHTVYVLWHSAISLAEKKYGPQLLQREAIVDFRSITFYWFSVMEI